MCIVFVFLNSTSIKIHTLYYFFQPISKKSDDLGGAVSQPNALYSIITLTLLRMLPQCLMMLGNTVVWVHAGEIIYVLCLIVLEKPPLMICAVIIVENLRVNISLTRGDQSSIILYTCPSKHF